MWEILCVACNELLQPSVAVLLMTVVQIFHLQRAVQSLDPLHTCLVVACITSLQEKRKRVVKDGR